MAIRTDDPLQAFLYLLMHDYLPYGAIEDLMHNLRENRGVYEFTAGHVADHAAALAKELRELERATPRRNNEADRSL